MVPINCIGRGGASQVYYLEDCRPTVFVHLRDPAQPNVDEVFDATFEISGNMAKSIMMSANHARYMAKGIPEAVLEYVKKNWAVDVCSSSNKRSTKTSTQEYRTPSATKVWERLKNANKATYDASSDQYWMT